MTYLKYLALLACTATVAACTSTSSPSGNTSPAAKGSADTTTINYTCQDGQPVQITFQHETETAELRREGATLPLRQQVSASGFIYGDGNNTIFGKGTEMTLELAQKAPIHCQEAAAQK